MNEAPPAVCRRARAAAWGDWNGDKKPDLLLATPTGPVLLTNLGDGTFPRRYEAAAEGGVLRSDHGRVDRPGRRRQAGHPAGQRVPGAAALPQQRAAAPANGKAKPADGVVAFEDVSDKVGLGKNGIAAGMKGISWRWAISTATGGRISFYTAGNGLLVKNTPKGSCWRRTAGSRLSRARRGAGAGGFRWRWKAGLTLVDGNQVKLFKNDGKGSSRTSPATARRSVQADRERGVPGVGGLQ